MQPEQAAWRMCVCQFILLSLLPQDLSAYSISVYIYIHIIIHAARLYGSFLQSSEQPPLRGQGSSMHQGQDVSRKLLSHNGATSSETFVQIYKNLFELQMEWGGRRGHLTWLERCCSTGNSSMSPTSVGHIRGSIFQQSLKLPTRSEWWWWCLARKRCKSERDMPANEE